MFKRRGLSKVPDDKWELSNEEIISWDDDSLQDGLKQSVQVKQKQKKKSLHSRIKDLGSVHGRKPRATSSHSRIESVGSGHGRVKISPSESQDQPSSTIAADAAQNTKPKKAKSCMLVKTLEESLNSCRMKPASLPDNHSSHSRATSSGNIVGNSNFGSIEIRQYTRILGDNPACADGPPIALGWKYSSQSTVLSVDEYEMGREPRREESALRLSIKRRETMLRALGYSTRDLIEADQVRKQDQISRERTVSRLKFQG
eukprot:CAMPEP_0113579332 /NCGR_PEP_ID=MMETSP0015_2-20120614/30012_1 /TAXON_ID=2838 /ORGANISM="Odontella" /LENGTH=257 /DNA_ID=CAMNT_0000483305 /DNA_START=173 /DNA_END=943 /DNA_ORIENTATION=- /assembly_acc=CAM_ASM_000160